MAKLLGAGLGLFLVLASPVQLASAQRPFQAKEFAEAAIIVFSTCPFGDWTPTEDTICEDFQVFFGRASATVGGGPVDRASAPFLAEYLHVTSVAHPDGTGDLLSIELGNTADVSGSLDSVGLTFARMEGATLHLNDLDPVTGTLTPNGRTATLGPFTWTAATDIYRFGNDGPLGQPLPDVRTRCQTTITNTNQMFTAAYVTGSVNGVPITNYFLGQPPPGAPPDAHGAIFHLWFHVLDFSHGCSL
jgi:hypothetical protein